MGFRPEHLFPAAAAGDADDIVPVVFTPVREEYLGAERLVYGDVEGTRTIARFPVHHAHRDRPRTSGSISPCDVLHEAVQHGKRPAHLR
ncbi:MAG: hypothetical protein R2843_08560 [Thermomicrobiales bacterium]